MVVDVAEGVRVARLERLPYLQGEGVPAAPDQADHLLQLQKKVHTKVCNYREEQLPLRMGGYMTQELVGAFNHEKALVGAFSVIVKS